jgi:AAA domain-containing protein
MEQRRVQLVVAATHETAAECKRIAEIVDELNRGLAGRRGIRFALAYWWTDEHDEFSLEGTRTASPKITDCDILLGVFWRRFGRTVETGVSSTEREISAAYAAWKQGGKPQLFMYFSERPQTTPTQEDSEQFRRIQRFQKNFAREEFWEPYTDEEDLVKKLRGWLMHHALAAGRESADGSGAFFRLYDYTKPVSDPRMFIGRAEIRNEILQGARRGDSYAVIGGTRSGKTSLLFEVKRVLMEELGSDSACVVGPVFLSTHQFPKLCQAAIYREIVANFRSTVLPLRFPKLDLGYGRLFEPTITEDQAFPAFQEVLEQIVRTVSQELRIVIMIDEVDELQRHEWSKTFFNNLRHLISQSPLQQNLSMVIAGTLAIYSLYRVAGSPFLNVISGTKRLRLLTLDESSELINAPTGSQVDPAIVQHMYSQTGGHPFLIQYIMKNLCDESSAALQGVKRDDVDRVVDKFLRERQDFSNWASKFRPHDKDVYRLIANSPEVIRKAEVVRAVGEAEQANDSLDLLAHLGLIRETERNRYEAGGLMFKTWFDEHFEDAKPAVSGQ